ncbi:tail fiber assembly protein [Erwinia endophytica]|uniref:tail fiber assembly protein n=1 Tax=Erwinia endophytica TaxID=1563158 RepID=UPI001265D9B3|nr:tail fiber assembly protein [Erwinia endophytica]KAB8307272.1 tail fiber assembly protein [Erwinia endophytica]
MINAYGPFSIRNDLNEEETALQSSHNVMFIADSDGNDWYELQKIFQAETLKIVFDENNLINSASYDASTLFPLSFYVAEMSTVPDDFTLPPPGGQWVFDSESEAISQRVYTEAELIEQAEQERTTRIAAATVVIDPLRDAVELGRATEEQRARLLAWQNYRIDLIELDLSVPSAVVWPDLPE